MDKLEEFGDTQIVTFPEIFNSNGYFFTSDGTAAVLGNNDGLGMSEINLNLPVVTIPVGGLQFIPDNSQIHQQVLNSEIVPSEPTTIYLDPSQLAFLNGGQLLITEDGLLTTSAALQSDQLTLNKVDTGTFLNVSETQQNIQDQISEFELCMETAEELMLEESAEMTSVLNGAQQSVGEVPVASTSREESAAAAVQEPETTPAVNKEEIQPPIRKGPFKCEGCVKEFQAYSQYRKHLQVHADDKPHKCSDCAASFNNPDNLVLHKAIHQQGSPQCPQCNKKFTRIASLKSHILIHEHEESLFCTECGDEFPNQLQLDRHLKSHDEEWVKPPAPIYECAQCDKQYSKAAVLRQHMKDHFKVKEARSVKSHNRALRRGRPLHLCTVCHKAFQKPSQLIRHQRIHTGERPFKCELCPRSFNQKGSLLIHMSSKHKGMRPFQCEFCSATFSQKGNLRAHVVRLHSIPNTQETVYQCSQCSCVFRKLGSLNAHLNRMHPPTDKITAEQASHELSELKKKIQLSGSCKDNSDKENEVYEERDTIPSSKLITVTNTLEDGSINHTTMKQRSIGTIKWHQCNYCGKEFKKPSDLVRHTRIHTLEKPYKCKHCFRAFTVRSSLVAHAKTHTKPKEFKCKNCPLSFPTQLLLRHHKSFPCAEAVVGQEFEEEEELPTEQEIEINISLPQPETMTMAEEAEETLPTLQEEEIQEVVQFTTDNEEEGQIITIEQADSLQHSELQQPLVLTEKGLMRIVTIKQIKQMQAAYNIPTPDKPHQCSICNLSYSKPQHLKIHLRTHSGERPYSCKECGRTFTSASVLKGHMRTHSTMLKPHKCEQCGKYLSTKGSLLRHTELHATIEPFMCPYCPKRYKSNSTCRKHIKTAHQFIITHEIDENGEKHQKILVQMNEEPEQLEDTEDQDEGEVTEFEMEDGGEVTEAEMPEFTVTLPNVPGFPKVEALIVNNGKDHQSVNIDPSLLTIGEPYISETEDGMSGNERVISRTLLVDGAGNITIPNLTAQDTLTQENIREIEESLNQQLFCAPELTLDKEQVVLFDQGFDQSVFPAITLQNEQLELGQVALSTANLSELVASGEKDTKLYSCDECNIHFFHENELMDHRINHLQLQKDCLVEARTITIGKIIQLEADVSGDNLPVDTENLPTIDLQPDIELRCEVCEHVSHGEEEQALHRRQHLSCDLCDKSFATASQYKAHIRSHGREKELACEHCGSTFSSAYSLSRHMVIHNPDKMFSCTTCSQMFRSETQLRRHMNAEHREKREKRKRGGVRELTEEEAKQVVSQEATSVSEHVLIASIAERDRITDTFQNQQTSCSSDHVNKCKYCVKSFRKPSDLVRHIRTHTGERPYQCDHCAKCFTVKSTLDSHMKTHNAAKPCPCHICGFYFATKGSLKVHMRLHTGSRPFRCPVCLQRFRTSGHRKAHYNLHFRDSGPGQEQHPVVAVLEEGAAQSDVDAEAAPVLVTEESEAINGEEKEEPSDLPQCVVCTRTFTKRSSLARHMMIHTGERPFQCPVCTKRFLQKKTLDTHFKIHTQVMEFECTECSKRFRQKCNLDKHRMRHHPVPTLKTPAPAATAMPTILQPYTIDLSESVDLDKVVSDLFPSMKTTKSLATNVDEM